MEESPTKKLVVSFEPKTKEKTVKTQKDKQKRQVTTTPQWTFNENDLEYENQMKLIKEIQENKIINREPCNFIVRQINNKIYGYRTQDIDKNLLCEEKLIDLQNVLNLMIKCENKCFYCKENVSNVNKDAIVSFVDKVMQTKDYNTVGWSRIPALLAASFALTEKEYR